MTHLEQTIKTFNLSPGKYNLIVHDSGIVSVEPVKEEKAQKKKSITQKLLSIVK